MRPVYHHFVKKNLKYIMVRYICDIYQAREDGTKNAHGNLSCVNRQTFRIPKFTLAQQQE